MAEAYHNSFYPNQADSVGTKVTKERSKSTLGQIKGTEILLEAMAEEGINLSKNMPQQLTENMITEYDKIIVMAEPETIPNYLKNSSKAIYWEIEDPKTADLERTKQIREQIKQKILSEFSEK